MNHEYADRTRTYQLQHMTTAYSCMGLHLDHRFPETMNLEPPERTPGRDSDGGVPASSDKAVPFKQVAQRHFQEGNELKLPLSWHKAITLLAPIPL
jgi:hypothetical protein